MLRKVLLVTLLCAPLPCLAQLQIFQFDGSNENAVGGAYQLPQTAPGDNLETRFHIRNIGLSSMQILTLTMTGDGFRLSSAPSLGYIIAPSNFVEVRVMFSPTGTGSYNGNLQVNSVSLTLRATVVAAATLSTNGAPIGAGSTIDFGKTQFGASVSQSFTLANPTNGPLTVTAITVSGAGFQGPIGISAPITLSAQQSITFSIAFAPAASLSYQGLLTIDTRSFNLTGLGLAPPLPAASIQLTSATALSGQQQKVSIQLASPSQIAATGTLSMSFSPSIAGPMDDPAIQFMSGPQRIATVTFQPGDSMGRFGSNSDLTFQTGTTAGQINFILTVQNTAVAAHVTMAPAIASFDTVSATRRVNDLDVNLIGFDNTHSASLLTFTFYDVNGNVMQPGAIKADETQSFKSYFASSQAGGAFALQATFPVTGDATQVGGVDVTMTNSVGDAKTQRITFQ